jgi:hypothetical protein
MRSVLKRHLILYCLWANVRHNVADELEMSLAYLRLDLLRNFR